MKITDGSDDAGSTLLNHCNGCQHDLFEQALQKSEANLRTIFDTTATIYILLDTDFRIISYNPRAVDFATTELNQPIRISEYFLDYFPPERQQILLHYMKERLAGKNINYEVPYPQPGNSANWYHVRLFPITRGDNDVYGLMFAVSNVTEKKTAGKGTDHQESAGTKKYCTGRPESAGDRTK